MLGKSYVLNLKRRPDRLSRFQEFYQNLGPDLPLTIFEAIDGSDPSQINKVPQSIIKCVSDDNDYDNKPSIKCTAYSHLMMWKEIAESDDEVSYFLIFEDDCFFRTSNELLPEISKESMKTKWPKIIAEYAPNLQNRKSLLYFGVGDLLPIHTVPPSESILIAQESNHVLTINKHKYYGQPNFNSPYVFSWLGLSGYVMSKKTAKYLLAIAAKQPINFAVDAWIKKLIVAQIIECFLTIPLMTFTPLVLDSNTSFPEKGYT